MTDPLKYLRPGAIVPIDYQTTQELVDALRAANGGQWIAVTKRLPIPMSPTVLIYPNGAGDVGVGWHEPDDRWYDLEYTDARPEVTHWAELPSPPTEASPEARVEQL